MYVRAVMFIVFVALAVIAYIWLRDRGKELSIGIRGGAPSAATATADHGTATSTASFVELDGEVRLRDASGLWSTAALSTELRISQVLKTSEESSAILLLADGSRCEVGPNSVIQLAQNVAQANRQSSVAVQLISGVVKIITPELQAGSRASVMVTGATLSLAPGTTATMMKADGNDRYQVFLTRGSAELGLASETVALHPYQRAVFQADAQGVTAAQELQPPTITAPADKLWVYGAAAKVVTLNWEGVEGAKGYRTTISRSRYLTRPIAEKAAARTGLELAGLGDGTYFWAVQSIDAQGRPSVQSDVRQFRVVARPLDDTVFLRVETVATDNGTVELVGQTEPGAVVMVNGDVVPVSAAGTFLIKLPATGTGKSVLPITAQDHNGRVTTLQQEINVPSKPRS
jgi:hypothetical protein